MGENIISKLNRIVYAIRKVAKEKFEKGEYEVTDNGEKVVKIKVTLLAFKLKMYPQNLYQFLSMIADTHEDIERERGYVVVKVKENEDG